MVQEKALEFAKAMGDSKFTASNGWLDRFKKREKINFKVGATILLLCLIHFIMCFLALEFLLFKIYHVLNFSRFGFQVVEEQGGGIDLTVGKSNNSLMEAN